MSKKVIKSKKRLPVVDSSYPVSVVDKTTGEVRQFTVGELLETIMQLKTMNENLLKTVDEAFTEFDQRLKALESKEPV